MVWLAADFAQERKWKKNSARKVTSFSLCLNCWNVLKKLTKKLHAVLSVGGWYWSISKTKLPPPPEQRKKKSRGWEKSHLSLPKKSARSGPTWKRLVSLLKELSNFTSFFFCPLTAGGVQTTNPIGGEAKTGAWSAFKLHSQRNRKVLISTHRRPNQSFERGKLTAFWTVPSVFLKFPDDDFDDESDASKVSILESYLCWQFEAFVWGVLIFLVGMVLFENLGDKFNLRYFLNRVPLNWQ